MDLCTGEPTEFDEIMVDLVQSDLIFISPPGETTEEEVP